MISAPGPAVPKAATGKGNETDVINTEINFEKVKGANE